MIYTIQAWILFFFIYCFFGWCFETALVSIEEKRFVNRGFLRSPFLPIYGFGALTMVIAGEPVLKDPVLVFVFGAVAATVLEFVTGWLLETIFKTRYWDYSDTHYNIKGRVCAEATLMWGFMTLLVNYKVHIHIKPFVLGLNPTFVLVLDIVLLIIFIADLIVSAKAAIDINTLLKQLTELKSETSKLTERIKEQLNEYSESSERIQKLNQKLEQLNQKKSNMNVKLNFIKRDYLKAHPNARSVKFNNALTELKIKLNSKKK